MNGIRRQLETQEMNAQGAALASEPSKDPVMHLFMGSDEGLSKSDFLFRTGQILLGRFDQEH